MAILNSVLDNPLDLKFDIHGNYTVNVTGLTGKMSLKDYKESKLEFKL